MPDRRTHRGPHPEDGRLFGREARPLLSEAAADFCWLLDRGYAHDSSLKLVGDRHNLVARQRTAVSRCCCRRSEADRRRQHEVGRSELRGAAVWLDGYNVLTTIEAALAGGVILAARDGAYRDMASMHGSYRKVAETRPALELLGRTLAAAEAAECLWLLDRPVSNSGRLKGIMDELAAGHAWPWRVELVPNPDVLLANPADWATSNTMGELSQTTPRPVIVATADSAVLDRCPAWYNLAREAICECIPLARVVELPVPSLRSV